QTAPYQVALEEDHTLVYVPEDDARCCREATPEDLRISRRSDALADLSPSQSEQHLDATPATAASELHCSEHAGRSGIAGYRSGRCQGCDCCPRNWTSVELYSEHYRCAERNGLTVTQCKLDLGTLRVGERVDHAAGERTPTRAGFMQCPTLARLPPGLRFSDDGTLAGEVQYDPHRDTEYRVEFVAISTIDWDDDAVGLVRLEISFAVQGNEAPNEFDLDAFADEQNRARNAAKLIVRDLVNTWIEWEQGQLSNRATCDRMCGDLRRLRELLELHPRLENGRCWAQLGGFHMNVHKLLENTLFECELYIGHALTFGDAEVRRQAEQNLKGCYQKRLLEAARFLWIHGVEQMMRGEWPAAARTLRLAAEKNEGWGWAVNHGDIWISESAARLVHGAELLARNGSQNREGEIWIAKAEALLDKAVARADDAGVFGPKGHPWAAEITEALVAYRNLKVGCSTEWLEAFKLRTVYWCAQVLAGTPPFPPQPRPRLEDADMLRKSLLNLY
ncbi:MAG: hypothetical protein AAF658_15940, partial [Myxococcota bacterium]